MLAKKPTPLIILKISGESLRNSHHCFDSQPLRVVAEQIRILAEDGLGCLVVVGGGNVFRGPRDASEYGLNEDEADLNGMTATGMNANNLRGACRKQGLETVIVGRGPCAAFGPDLSTSQLRHELQLGRVCIIAGGSGKQGVSTDVPAVQLAAELDAQKLIMSKHGVDGIYTSDPNINPSATFLPSVTATEALDAGLRVMDAQALELSRQTGVEIHVVAAASPSGLIDAAYGDRIGSVIIPT